MYTLKVTLRQHTPLIHFQSEQAGATLRVTELKPKLDKFLQSAVQLRPEWQLRTVNPDAHALDYQIRVKPVVKEITGENIRTRTAEYPGFFGNMGAGRETVRKKYVKSASDYVDVQFFSLDSNLLAVIRHQLPAFLSLHNFGTRQSKGFGCFYIAETDSLYQPPVLPYAFTLPDNLGVDAVEDVFRQLDLFYRTLRAGINLNGAFYFKSLLFKYAKDGANNQWRQSFQWEKKTIKQTYYDNDRTAADYRLSTQQAIRPYSEPLTFSSPDKKLFKDLLGLSSTESWRGYGNITKTHIRAESDPRHIARFGSPIMFKPIWQNGLWHIYFGVKTNPYQFPDSGNGAVAYLGESFSIAPGRVSNLTLALPATFDIDHYLRYVFDRSNFNIASHVEAGPFQRTPEYRWLEAIYRQLQNRQYS